MTNPDSTKEQQPKDTRDEIIGRLTVELAEFRKQNNDLYGRLAEIRESLENTKKMTEIRGLWI